MGLMIQPDLKYSSLLASNHFLKISKKKKNYQREIGELRFLN